MSDLVKCSGDIFTTALKYLEDIDHVRLSVTNRALRKRVWPTLTSYLARVLNAREFFVRLSTVSMLPFTEFDHAERSGFLAEVYRLVDRDKSNQSTRRRIWAWICNPNMKALSIPRMLLLDSIVELKLFPDPRSNNLTFMDWEIDVLLQLRCFQKYPRAFQNRVLLVISCYKQGVLEEPAILRAFLYQMRLAWDEGEKLNIPVYEGAFLHRVFQLPTGHHWVGWNDFIGITDPADKVITNFERVKAVTGIDFDCLPPTYGWQFRLLPRTDGYREFLHPHQNSNCVLLYIEEYDRRMVSYARSKFTGGKPMWLWQKSVVTYRGDNPTRRRLKEIMVHEERVHHVPRFPYERIREQSNYEHEALFYGAATKGNNYDWEALFRAAFYDYPRIQEVEKSYTNDLLYCIQEMGETCVDILLDCMPITEITILFKQKYGESAAEEAFRMME